MDGGGYNDQQPKKRRTGFSDGPADPDFDSSRDWAHNHGQNASFEPQRYNAVPPPGYHSREQRTQRFQPPQDDRQDHYGGEERHSNRGPSTRVEIPFNTYRDVDFVGLLKTESSTLHFIESDTKCQITLKGRGFEKPEATDEDMHIIVTGPDHSSVGAAKSDLVTFLTDPQVHQRFKVRPQSGFSSAPAPDNEKPIWYYVSKQTNEQVGPMTFSKMRSLYASREIDDNSYVWNEGFDSWKYIHQLPELKKDLQGGGFAPKASESVVCIPNRIVGLFIGKGGAHIKDFEMRYGTKIQPQKEADMFPGSQERELTVTGPSPNVEATKQGILAWVAEISDKGPGSSSTPTPGGFRSGGPAGSEVIHVPNSVVGFLIGKAGAKIIELQSKSGAKIQTGKDNETDNVANTRPVYISGDPHQVALAKQLVHDTVAEANQRSQGTGGGNPYGPSGGFGGGSSTEEFMVPPTAVGLVIGKGGSKIQELQALTGAKIHLVTTINPPNSSSDRPFNITGTPDQRERAKQMIHDLINERSTNQAGPGGNRFQPGQRGGHGGRGGHPNQGFSHQQHQYQQHQHQHHQQHQHQHQQQQWGQQSHQQGQQQQQQPYGQDYQNAYAQAYQYGNYGAYGAYNATQYPGYRWDGQEWVYDPTTDPNSGVNSGAGAEKATAPGGSTAPNAQTAEEMNPPLPPGSP